MSRESIRSSGREICQLLGVETPAGLADNSFVGMSTLDEAMGDHVSFLARPQYRSRVAGSRAGLVLVPQNVELDDPRAVFVADVWKAVLVVLTHFFPPTTPRGVIHPTAIVPDSCQIAATAEVGPYCVFGEDVIVGEEALVSAHAVIGDGVVIGNRTQLHPRVTIAHGCRIGDRVILHSGVVIGSDGFRYEAIDRRATKIPQVGIVVIEEDVEIGANTTIDRASFSQTSVGARTKIDNLVQIGHNVEIGSDCLIVSQVGIAGSTKIGRGVVLAGQVGVGDNVTIGDGVRLGARSGVHTSIPPGKDFMGAPALDAAQYFKMVSVMRRLPELYERLKPILREFESRGGESVPDPLSSRSD